MREYSANELIAELDQQAQKMLQGGFIEKSILDPEKFLKGVANISIKIKEQTLTVKTKIGIPIVLVLPLSMISFQKFISTSKIDFDSKKIKLKNLQSFNHLEATNTLHALLGPQEYLVTKGLPEGKADQIYRTITNNGTFSFNFAQALSLIYFYPGILSNGQAIDITAQRINGQAPYIITNNDDNSSTAKILMRPHWEASPQDLIALYFKMTNVITANSN